MLRFLMILALAAGVTSHSEPQSSDRLSRTDSGRFAQAAERAGLEPRYRSRSLGLDFEGTKPNPHFYTWSVIPSWGQGVVFFVVDRRTGDVWPYLGCERVRSPELAALQARFRQRFGVRLSQVRRIEKEGSPVEECRSPS